MSLRLALVGFGGVNRTLVRLLHERGTELAAAGHRFAVTAVSDQHFGEITDPNGINLEKLANASSDQGSFAGFNGGKSTCDPLALLQLCEADVAIEATYSNPVDGQPALSFCRKAVARGMHVITTNKGPATFSAPELRAEAAKHGRQFLFEGTVMSGTPVLRFAENCLVGNRVTGFRGILNGTANFVLGRVEEGLAMAEGIAEAQALGYAEANPDADLKGSDVALKVAILANTIMGAAITPADIKCVGIADLQEEEIRDATRNGARWKLIGEAKQDLEGAIHASVEPQLLPLSDPLSGVSGATNAITFSTDLLGDVTVSGPGAGKVETAYAILSDLLHLK